MLFAYRFVPVVLGCSLLVGCAPSAPAPKPTAEHGHGHEEQGPHGGELIELGKEEYHAELVHDQSDVVRIYLLDGGAKKSASTKETECVLNLVIEGSPRQFTMAAKPQADDAEGTTSCFEVTDAAAAKALAAGATGRFNVTIADKPFVGEIAKHDHAHKH